MCCKSIALVRMKPFKLYKGGMKDNKTYFSNFEQSLNGFLSRYLPLELKALLASRKTNYFSGKKT